jgi:hypothetical protein
MKDQTFNSIALLLATIALLLATIKIEKLEKYQTCTELQATIADLRHENKRAILDLTHYVKTLRIVQAIDDAKEKYGDYSDEWFEIRIPPIKIGECMECHDKYPVAEEE